MIKLERQGGTSTCHCITAHMISGPARSVPRRHIWCPSTSSLTSLTDLAARLYRVFSVIIVWLQNNQALIIPSIKDSQWEVASVCDGEKKDVDAKSLCCVLIVLLVCLFIVCKSSLRLLRSSSSWLLRRSSAPAIRFVVSNYGLNAVNTVQAFREAPRVYMSESRGARLCMCKQENNVPGGFFFFFVVVIESEWHLLISSPAQLPF